MSLVVWNNFRSLLSKAIIRQGVGNVSDTYFDKIMLWLPWWEEVTANSMKRPDVWEKVKEERRGRLRGWDDWIAFNSVDMNLSKLRLVMDWEAWCFKSMRLQTMRGWAWTDKNIRCHDCSFPSWSSSVISVVCNLLTMDCSKPPPPHPY